MLNENKKLIPNSTQLPNIITDFVAPKLREGELKCLLYICRRTYGFHKEEDRISLSQFIKGIIDKNGKRLDYGAGASKPVTVQALANLEKANLIFIKREVDGNYYQLNLQVNTERALRKIKEIRAENLKIKREKPKQSRLIEVVRKPNHPQLGNLTSNSKETLPEVVRKPNTQKIGKQRETKNMSQATDFDLKVEIEKMLADSRMHIKIIGFWIREKQLNPENRDQLSSLIKRNCRPAMLLVGYKSQDIALTIKALKTTEYIKKFTLETVSKFIDEIIAQKPKTDGRKFLRWEVVTQNGSQAMRAVYA